VVNQPEAKSFLVNSHATVGRRKEVTLLDKDRLLLIFCTSKVKNTSVRNELYLCSGNNIKYGPSLK